MKKHFLSLIVPLMALTVLLSCSKGDNTERRIEPPPVDTTGNHPPPSDTKKWIVSTFAGSGTQGKDDGDSIYAGFWSPSYITIDPQGNLFVSDLQNFNIRKITPNRHVSTYSGRDVSTPNPAFGNIYGLALDKQGNLFDIEYNLVRKTTPSVDVSVFAGSMMQGYKDTVGVYAAFKAINQVAIDKDDNLYLTDFDQALYPQIRKITPDATVTTLSLQDNTGFSDLASPNYYYLFPIAADGNGNLYRGSNGNCLIKKITPDGNVTVFAGAGNIGFTDGQGADAQFFNVAGIATDSVGNLYLADSGNGAIRKVSTTGKVTTIAGTGEQGFADGEGSQAKFNYPIGIAVDKKGVIYVADQGNNRIRKIEYK